MGVHLKLEHNFFLRCLARRLHGLRNVETQRENAETAALDPTATWGLATAMDRKGTTCSACAWFFGGQNCDGTLVGRNTTRIGMWATY
jgi:hypothetical protein